MRDAKLDAIALVEARRRGDDQALKAIAAGYEGTDLRELVGALIGLCDGLLTDLVKVGADEHQLIDGYRRMVLGGGDA